MAKAGTSFDEVLPNLRILWRRGVLVPFIGSGMSRDTLEGWDGFLIKLVRALHINLGVKEPEAIINGADTPTKYRIAERVALAAKALPPHERAEVIRKALCASNDTVSIKPPRQMYALAKMHWPLAVTTNYDDFYLAATPEPRHINICGRGRDDCHRVLRSLDENAPPILWAVQGFLGGLAIKWPNSESPDAHMRELIEQVVIGHQQYVHAANSEPHFRRAFAEVFRRRSLLFVGSGLQEEYFANLFAEIVHHHGLGAFPHFALLSTEAEVDPWFLETRLGIKVVSYPSFRDLPELLMRLSDAVTLKHSLPHESERETNVAAVAPSEFGFRLSRPNDSLHRSITVRCTWGRLLVPKLGNDNRTGREASVVSVGRLNNTPLHGSLSQSHLEAAERESLIDAYDYFTGWKALDDAPSYVFRFGRKSPIFAVAARRKDFPAENYDRRDLRIIPDAVCTTLRAIDGEKYERVMLGPVASGKLNTLHPLHTFAQTLRGIHKFANGDSRSIREIVLYLVAPRVWALLAAGKVPVAELLGSQLLTFRLEVWDHDGHLDSIRFLHTEFPTINELIEKARFNSAHWRVFLSPPPTDKHRTMSEVEAGELDEALSSTMTVILRPRGSPLSSA